MSKSRPLEGGPGRGRQKPLQTLGSILLFVAVFLASDVLAFGLVWDLLYDKLSELSIQIIASLASLALTCVVLVAVRFSLLLRYRDAFVQVTDVVERLTRGDFDITPGGDYRLDPTLGGLVRRIDTMAVELKKTEDMRREFVSNVSHEIQSPLTSIRGYARALDNEALGPRERHEYLSIIQQESDRLSQLSANLLRLAALDAEVEGAGGGALGVCGKEAAVVEKAGAGAKCSAAGGDKAAEGNGSVADEGSPDVTAERSAQEDRQASYRLDRQLRSTLLALEPEWAGKHIELEASLPTTVIHADEELVGHVWTNLLGNAIKFTPDGGQIRVTLIEQDGRAVCRIADTGIGIAPEALPRIFDRFYKADESQGLYAGSGLGLAIVAKIVERSGGSIAVKSELGEGTVVSVTLPKGV